FMKKMIRILVLLMLAGSLRTFSATPEQPAKTNGAASAKSGSKLNDLFPDTVIAKGKGLEIKRSQLDDEVIKTKSAYAASQKQAPADLEARVLDGLLGAKLILSKATDEDKAKAKEKFEKSLET